MEASTAVPAASFRPEHQQQAQHHQRRPRRNRGGPRGGGDASLSLRPASVAPHGDVSSSHPQLADSETLGSQSRRGGGARGGRGRGRGRSGRAADGRFVNGRAFGGQLTQPDSITPESAASTANNLQAEAAVFVPGQQHVHIHSVNTRKGAKGAQPRPPKQRLPKSDAPDIATRTHQDIDHGHYECPICTSEVQRNSKVWSCHTCWTVFHLTCIKKWSSNQGSSANQQDPQSGDLPPRRQWRCPGCNLPKDVLPTTYTCWCEKENDPRPLPGLPPHSCGQTCGKDRVRKCPHPCQLTCHAGPCPPCTHMGPTQNCFCGRHETTKRCAETEYTSGWSCAETCGAALACGDHFCERPCHDGDCGSCQVRLPARCYCGQMEKDVLCCDREDAKLSRKAHHGAGEAVVEEWTGLFDCGNTCDRDFDCGVHHCEKQCHPQDSEAGHCPRSPDVVKHCSCGKTPLEQMTDRPRLHCEDPIPACEKPCEKLLACGHSCPKVCHSGECPSCMRTVEIKCRCGRTSSKTICHQGSEERPQCMRPCRVNLNCGRHACDERCCTGEKKAVERQSAKRKLRPGPLSSAPVPAEDGFEAEHICTRQCGRQLKCGNHLCEELCHKGPCGTCREAIFEEISCNCGRTVLMPPLPCGTQPPPCRYACERPKACGHPQVAHNCHLEDDGCPRCPFLVQRQCLCGKKTLKNQQCWFRDVRCGEVCGRRLKCGSHFCQKPCHRPGQCEDASGQPCQQPCGKEKKICGHPDEAPCHAPYPCKEEKPCQSKIFITCDCQAQKQAVKCGASKSSEGNTTKSLPCNDECAKLERNRKLAVALNIDQSTHVDGGDHIPFSPETLNLFAQNTKWAQAQEREFRVFATSSEEKRLRFKPMQPNQRSFIHALAADFGLDSESVDPEPHRHVMIWKTPLFVSAPNKTLADALRIRQQAQRSVNASANVSENEGPSIAKPAKLKITEPFNALVIKRPRFGLTIDEVRAEVNAVTQPSNAFTFDIEFLPSEDVVLKAISRTLPPAALEQQLQNIKNPLATAIAKKGYGSTQLCVTDTSLNITRLESDNTSGDGWSRVAAKKAAPKFNVPNNAFGATNSFAALTEGKVTFAKKKPEKARPPPAKDVVDDWEAAELAEEEKERMVSASEDETGPKVADVPEGISDSESPTVTQAATEIPATSSEHQDWASEVERDEQQLQK